MQKVNEWIVLISQFIEHGNQKLNLQQTSDLFQKKLGQEKNENLFWNSASHLLDLLVGLAQSIPLAWSEKPSNPVDLKQEEALRNLAQKKLSFAQVDLEATNPHSPTLLGVKVILFEVFNQFSAQDWHLLRVAFFLIFSWGVLPCLEANTFVPVNLRDDKIKPNVVLSISESFSLETRNQRLQSLVSRLGILFSEQHELRFILVSRHLSDYLSLLFHFDHMIVSPSRLVFQIMESIEGHLRFFGLLELLKIPNIPTWLSSEVANGLSWSIMQSNGISSFFYHLFQDRNDVTEQELSIAEQILTKIPKSISTPEYFKKIIPQLFLLLDQPISKNDVSNQATCRVLGRIIQILPAAQKLVVCPLMDPLLVFFVQQKPPNCEVLVSEDEIEKSLDRISKMCDVNRGRNPIFWKNLVPYTQILYLLHLQTSKSRSYLRIKVSTLLSLLFRDSFLLKKTVFELPFLKLNPFLFFAPASSGGFEIRIQQSDFHFQNDLILKNQNDLILKNQNENDFNLLPLISLIDPEMASSLFLELLQMISMSLEPCSNHFELALELLSRFQERLVQDLSSLLVMIKLLLESSQSISLALSILNVVLSEIGIPDDQIPFLFEMIPLLHGISLKDPEIQKLILNATDSIQNKKFRILPNQKILHNPSSLQDIFQLLQAPLLVSRVQGMRSLRLLAKNKQLLEEDLDSVLKILTRQLSTQEESFEYLNAIQCLSALADVFPDRIIPFVLKNYNHTKLSEPVILKLGEAIVQIVIMLGEMVVKFSDSIMHSLLVNTKHPLPTIRASALSNLAQTVLQLRFGVHSHVSEILTCSFSLATSDSDPMVKRSAVLLLCSLFEGLDSELFKNIPQDLLRNILRHILLLKQNNDPILFQHIQNLIDILNHIIF